MTNDYLITTQRSVDDKGFFDLFETSTLCFGHKFDDKDKLKHHHETEEREGVSATKLFCEIRKGEGNDSRHQPMREATQRLTVGPHFIWKDFRDKYPNNSALRKGKEGNINKQKNRYR